MKDGAYKEITHMYARLLKNNQDEKVWLLKQQAKEIHALARQCIKEHGSHNDDGSMFYGFCTRCGECLG